MEVTTISKMMKTVKEEIAEVEQLQVIALVETDTSTNLVSQFLKSVVASPVKAISTKEVEVLTPNKEVLVVNEVVAIDDIGNKSNSDDSLDYNVATRSIAEVINQTGVTSNNSSVSE